MRCSVLLILALLVLSAPLALCETIRTDVAPYESGGTVMVPMRAIFEWLGAEVSFDTGTGFITAKREEQVVSLKPGVKTATVNGESKNMSTPAVSRNGRTFVPLRFIAEAFGAEVTWNAESQKISVIDNRRVGNLYLAGQDLLDLIAEGKVEAKATGSSIEKVYLQIRRLVDYPVKVRIQAGIFFVSDSSSAQNMVTRRSKTIELLNDGWLGVSVSAACANRRRDIPGIDNTFSLQRSPYQRELEKLMPALDKANADFAVEQAAVWIITDDADYDDLGTLLRGHAGFESRVIRQTDAARAMRIIYQTGIDITSKAIWKDRHEIADGVEDQQLKKWLLSEVTMNRDAINRDLEPRIDVTTAIAGLEDRSLPDVVGSVNGEEITKEQLLSKLIEWGSPKVLEELITICLVDQEARKAGVVVTTNDVMERIETEKAKLSSDQSWDDMLTGTGLTSEHAFVTMRTRMQAEGVLRKSMQISDEDLGNKLKEWILQLKDQANIEYLLETKSF